LRPCVIEDVVASRLCTVRRYRRVLCVVSLHFAIENFATHCGSTPQRIYSLRCTSETYTTSWHRRGSLCVFAPHRIASRCVLAPQRMFSRRVFVRRRVAEEFFASCHCTAPQRTSWQCVMAARCRGFLRFVALQKLMSHRGNAEDLFASHVCTAEDPFALRRCPAEDLFASLPCRGSLCIMVITVNVTNVTCRGCYHFRWSETSLGSL